MKDWIQFRTMWTPTLIQMVFIIGSVVLVFLGGREMIEGDERSERLIGLAVLLLGPPLLRMLSEWIVVVFKIHQALENLRKEMAD